MPEIKSLKPCPICGCSDIKIWEVPEVHNFAAYCERCNYCAGYGESRERAFAIWNEDE